MAETRLKRRGMLVSAAAAGFIAYSQTAHANIIYSQTFAEGTYTYAGDTLTPPSSPSGLLKYYTGGSPSSFNVLSDPDMGTALDFNDAGQKLLSGSLPSSATLGSDVGDTLTYSFTFRVPTPGSTNDTASLRFGLFNDNGTPVTAAFTSGTAAANDDYGYSAYLGIGSNYVTVEHETNKGSGTLTNDITNDTRLTTTSTAPNISDGNAHTFLFTLTEESGGVNVALAVDGTTYYSGLDPTSDNPVTSFNNLQFWEHDNLDLRVNDISIQATTVPEPMSLGLLSLGTSGLLLRRRHRVG